MGHAFIITYSQHFVEDQSQHVGWKKPIAEDLNPTQGKTLGSGIYETISQMSATLSMDLDNTAIALAYKHLFRVFLSP